MGHKMQGDTIITLHSHVSIEQLVSGQIGQEDVQRSKFASGQRLKSAFSHSSACCTKTHHTPLYNSRSTTRCTLDTYSKEYNNVIEQVCCVKHAPASMQRYLPTREPHCLSVGRHTLMFTVTAVEQYSHCLSQSSQPISS